MRPLKTIAAIVLFMLPLHACAARRGLDLPPPNSSPVIVVTHFQGFDICPPPLFALLFPHRRPMDAWTLRVWADGTVVRNPAGSRALRPLSSHQVALLLAHAEQLLQWPDGEHFGWGPAEDVPVEVISISLDGRESTYNLWAIGHPEGAPIPPPAAALWQLLVKQYPPPRIKCL